MGRDRAGRRANLLPLAGTRAQALLAEIVANWLLQPRAVRGPFPANSVGDDVELRADAKGEHVLAILHTVRQQQEKSGDAPYKTLADRLAEASAELLHRLAREG